MAQTKQYWHQLPFFPCRDNLLNRDILHSLCMHIVLKCCILYGEETDKEERNMCFSYSTPREITQGLKRVWYLQMGGTTSSSRIILDVDMALKALEIVQRKLVLHLRGQRIEMGTEGQRQVKGEVSDGGMQKPKMRVVSLNSPKGFSSTIICCSCAWRKNGTSLSSSLTQLFIIIKKLALRTNNIKLQIAINQ